MSFLFLFVPSLVFAYYDLGRSQGFVSDFAETISPSAETQLGLELENFEKETSHEIAVVIISSLQGDTIENFAVKLFENWKIGKKDADNGVLLLIAKEDRKMKIEVGYGLEPVLTDILASKIIQNILRPAFQDNRFDDGIVEAVAAIEKIIQGEEVFLQNVEELPPPNIVLIFVILGFFPLIFRIILLFMASVGKTRSWWQGGLDMAGLSTFLSLAFWAVSFVGVIVFILVMTIIGFILDYIASKSLWFQKKSLEFHKKQFWFFGGGGRHGKGGFGGFGGGSSGGGGASGSW